MEIYFYDTSALLKRYVIENGTSLVQGLLDPAAGNRTVIAPITPIELVSALQHQARQNSISKDALNTNLELVKRHVRRNYVIVPFSDDTVSLATELLGRYVLRTLDAIQLGSALIVNQHLVARQIKPLIFVCADHRLISAASEAGLQVIEPK
jgi:uncharacterized protein